MKSGKNYEELQRCAPGMIKEGICSNKNCRGSNLEFVTINRGFSTEKDGFCLTRELLTDNICPGCQRKTKVDKIAFFKCWYKYEYMKYGSEDVEHTQWKEVDNVYHTLLGNTDDVEYTFFSIYVVQNRPGGEK